MEGGGRIKRETKMWTQTSEKIYVIKKEDGGGKNVFHFLCFFVLIQYFTLFVAAEIKLFKNMVDIL